MLVILYMAILLYFEDAGDSIYGMIDTDWVVWGCWWSCIWTDSLNVHFEDADDSMYGMIDTELEFGGCRWFGKWKYWHWIIILGMSVILYMELLTLNGYFEDEGDPIYEMTGTK